MVALDKSSRRLNRSVNAKNVYNFDELYALPGDLFFMAEKLERGGGSAARAS